MKISGQTRKTFSRCILVLYCCALAVFQYSFFSSRRHLSARSSAATIDSSTRSTLLDPTHTRVFLFIVDALRLDFVTGTKYAASFPHLHDLLCNNPSQSRIYNFRADPPTVTSQRLAAITTGTIPTFIDFTGNFNSRKIVEDSWLEQLSVRYPDRDRVFLGDDTWMSLFPNTFSDNLSFPFDSFNTRDLDTVDQGIETHLFPYLYQEPSRDWSLIVAHFLGVDHIGHTFSATHPLMEERLYRMDKLLHRVIQVLPPDALLLFFGDHGMTNDGNHGGSTREETDAVLFAYSPKPIFPPTGVSWNASCGCYSPEVFVASHYCQGINKKNNTAASSSHKVPPPLPLPRVVSQNDIVPTISLLLGLPIPYSNIGSIIPEFFCENSNCSNLDSYLNSNVDQVSRYFSTMGVVLSEAKSENGWAYLSQARDMGVSMWAQHCVPMMLFAVFVLFMAFAFVAWSECAATPINAQLQYQTRRKANSNSKDFYRTQITANAAAPMLGIVHACSVFSNSCILEEHWTCLFVFQTLLFLIIFENRLIIPTTSPRSLIYAFCGLFLARIFLSPRNISIYNANGAAAFIYVCAGVHILYFNLPAVCSLHGIFRGLVLFCCLFARNRRNLTLNLFVVCVVGLDTSVTLFHSLSNRCHHLTPLKENVVCYLANGLAYSLGVLVLLTTPGNDCAFAAGFAMLVVVLPNILERLKQPLSPLAISVLSTVFGRMLFYSTSHKFDFGTLHLAAGFTVSEKFYFISAGLFLFINTVGSEMICFLWTQSQSKSQSQSQSQSQTQTRAGSRVGKGGSVTNVITYRMLLVFCACSCVLVHRRHLMVWNIFAPKLIFELAFFAPYVLLFAVFDFF